MTHHAGTSTDPVERAIARAHGILPDQGPIGVFVHHNTLHAFQHLTFHEAVQTGASVIGARPYLDIHEYREAWERGRIEDTDADAAILRMLGDRAAERVTFGLSRHEFTRAMMRDVLDEDDEAGLHYQRGHSHSGHVRFDASQRTRALHGARLVDAARDRLGRVTADAEFAGATSESADLRRHRDALVALGAGDSDVAVHGELVRLCAVFLDHGQALAEMPRRHEGFLRAVGFLFADGATEPAACRGIRGDMLRALNENVPASVAIADSLEALGVPHDEQEEFVLATALALPGWTGMFSRLERHPEEREGSGAAALADVLAVRLMYERRAIEAVCAANQLPVAWLRLKAAATVPRSHSIARDAWMLAGVAESAGVTADAVGRLTDLDLAAFWNEVAALPRIARRRLLHDAYERRYRRQILDGLHAIRPEIPEASNERPQAQFMFCIDEREESLRRALEEQGPQFETFGVAGFFGIAIDYLGLYDEAPAAHCPVVVTPAHEVHESAVPSSQHWHIKRSSMRDRWRAASRMVHRHSRTLSGGAGLSFVLGPLAAALALSRVIAPRTSLAIADSARERWAPRPATKLSAIRTSAEGDARSERGKFVGFTLDEAVDRVTNLLRAIGLVEHFAPVVFVLGHGSTSLNNPHESAHDCGACGGRRGGTNARLFAEMANSPELRAVLRERGLHIPDDTWFVGGLHDTSDDGVTLYDLEFLPVGHAEA
ncbi:MAG TPA: putative inorganic carbon transporter subunit DabA, partial [Gemmatimonas sp.]|nr:putative inorganic carbon transporter subunit DabA [Gemmatimonas sp.]